MLLSQKSKISRITTPNSVSEQTLLANRTGVFKETVAYATLTAFCPHNSTLRLGNRDTHAQSNQERLLAAAITLTCGAVACVGVT